MFTEKKLLSCLIEVASKDKSRETIRRINVRDTEQYRVFEATDGYRAIQFFVPHGNYGLLDNFSCGSYALDRVKTMDITRAYSPDNEYPFCDLSLVMPKEQARDRKEIRDILALDPSLISVLSKISNYFIMQVTDKFSPILFYNNDLFLNNSISIMCSFCVMPKRF